MGIREQSLTMITNIRSRNRISLSDIKPNRNITELKTEAVIGKKISDLRQIFDNNNSEITGLKNRLMEAGIRPNGYLRRFAEKVSTEAGELGRLETELFALENRIHGQESFIDNMQRQLLGSE